MMLTYLQNSAVQARAILGAWQTGNSDHLSRELNHVNHLRVRAFDSAEAERMELLSAITGELLVAGHNFDDRASNVYSSLLQNIAFPGMSCQESRPN